jgi:hypothetical protein
MAYNRLNASQKAAMDNLPAKLKPLADEIFWDAQTQGCFHDTATDMLDRSQLVKYSNAEIKQVLEAMGSYWDYDQSFGVAPDER